MSFVAAPWPQMDMFSQSPVLGFVLLAYGILASYGVYDIVRLFVSALRGNADAAFAVQAFGKARPCCGPHRQFCANRKTAPGELEPSIAIENHKSDKAREYRRSMSGPRSPMISAAQGPQSVGGGLTFALSDKDREAILWDALVSSKVDRLTTPGMVPHSSTGSVSSCDDFELADTATRSLNPLFAPQPGMCDREAHGICEAVSSEWPALPDSPAPFATRTASVSRRTSADLSSLQASHIQEPSEPNNSVFGEVSDNLVSEMLLRIAEERVSQVDTAPNCRRSSTVDNVDHHVERSFAWEAVAMQRALCLPLQNACPGLDDFTDDVSEADSFSNDEAHEFLAPMPPRLAAELLAAEQGSSSTFNWQHACNMRALGLPLHV